MKLSLTQFVWTYSKREQIALLLVTTATFPILYLSLELPKRIINDAIESSSETVVFLGISFSQVELLMTLCFAFLLSVLLSGVLKMRINTMKGVVAERLLRRFRYQLITRVMRFPRPFFRTTSQGELVSMITSEAEPMGGFMGEMLAQPVFQAGKMMTILVFMFAQSIWFGLASVALIPLQAWLIPRLQRQINTLNKERISEVRKLATDIGETASAASDIRTNGGLRHRMSLFSMRLGKLFSIRFEIYKKKFFMKFLNNFINQLTPFFFYSAGGYLAITGEITVGALVAALAAYKDLSSPWRELLNYYNQAQDMRLRWKVVNERFSTSTLVDDSLFEGTPTSAVSLKGDISIENVTVRDEDGNTVLEDINLTIPQGSRVAIKVDSEKAARAIADILTREVVPQHGTISLAGHPITSLHQTTLAERIGYAHSNPTLLQGTLGENLLLPFKRKPVAEIQSEPRANWRRQEAKSSGNTLDNFDADWVDPSIAGLQSTDDIKAWWFQLVEAMGIDDFMVRRALRSPIDPSRHPELTQAIIDLRPIVKQRLAEAGLSEMVYEFHPDEFNPCIPMGANLMYAMPRHVLSQVELAGDQSFVQILREQGIANDLSKLASQVIDSLISTFGQDGSDHPLFQRLNMEGELYRRMGAIANRRETVGDDGLPPEDYALMLTLPFMFSAEQIGPAVDEALVQRILRIRKHSAKRMVDAFDELFEMLDPGRYIRILTLAENALYGSVSPMAGAREHQIEDVVVEVLNDNGLRRLAAQSIFDLETTSGGNNLPTVFKERVAFSRAGIKKPDILILGNALASHNSKARSLMRERISDLLPDATKIFIERQINSPLNYDVYAEIIDGRIDNLDTDDPTDQTAKADLKRKLRVIAKTDLFSDLEAKYQRILAYSAQWYEAPAGKTVFTINEQADAAYLCIEGLAGLFWRGVNEEDRLISEIAPGRLIGDLSVILNKPRTLKLEAIEDSIFLRIGAADLISVIESDVKVAASLLRTVGGHLGGAGDTIRAMQEYAKARGVDFSEFY